MTDHIIIIIIFKNILKYKEKKRGSLSDLYFGKETHEKKHKHQRIYRISHKK